MSGLELLPKAKAVRPDVSDTKRKALENGAEATTLNDGPPHNAESHPVRVFILYLLEALYDTASLSS